jgi:hypothetical protein
MPFVADVGVKFRDIRPYDFVEELSWGHSFHHYAERREMQSGSPAKAEPPPEVTSTDR